MFNNVLKKAAEQREYIERQEEEKKIDGDADEESEMPQVSKYVSKGQRRGTLRLDDVVDDGCCLSCECVMVTGVNTHCIDCIIAANKKDMDLIKYVHEYEGDTDDVQYKTNKNTFIKNWNHNKWYISIHQ